MEPNYDLLDETQLELGAQGRYDEMSETALRYLAGEEFGFGETFMANAQRAVTSSLRGLGISEPDPVEDQRLESEARLMGDRNMAGALAGGFVGSLLDPVQLPATVLAPIKLGGAVATGVARGAAAGAFGGAIEPVYEEFGDSRLKNIGVGTAFGAGIGGAVHAVLKRFGFDTTDPNIAKKIENLPEEDQAKLAKAIDDEHVALKADAEARAGKEEDVIPEAPKAEEPVFPVDKEVRWNNEAKTFETVETVTPQVDFNLPKQLAGEKSRFLSYRPQFDNGLDRAFYIIAKPTKSAAHDAYVDWAKSVTGLPETELKAAAKAAHKELVQAMGKATPEGEYIKVPASQASQAIMAKLTTPQQVVTPVQPARVVTKSSFSDSDVKLLEKAGVTFHTTPAGTIVARDAFAPRKPFLSNQELAVRMKAAGIDLDLSGVRKRKVQEAPVEAPKTPVEAPKQQVEAEVPPVDIGVPKQQISMGAAGTRPEQVYGPELNPTAYNKPEQALLRMLEAPEDDPRLIFPKEVVKGTGSFQGAKVRGAKELKKLLAEHGDMASFMLFRKGKAENMTEAETVAFRWFYADAMKKREDIIQRAMAAMDRGDDFDTPEMRRMAEDMVYYSGVDLFYKNEGTKVSRAMNARRIVNAQMERAGVAGTMPEYRMFPNVSC